MSNQTETLGEAYDRELNRNRELLTEYKRLPASSGWFAVTMLTEMIARAEKAARDGDVVAMLSIYAELQESE